MKKRGSCLIISVIFILFCVVQTSAFTPKTGYFGDVNMDGKVTAVDARWILQIASGLRTADKRILSIADITCDSKVNAIDARWALQTASGLRDLVINDTYYPISDKGMVCPLQYPNVSVLESWNSYPGHKGIDFITTGPEGNTYGKEIRAAADGVVYSAEMHYSWGYNVYINHGNGVYTRYAHCSKMLVSKGQTVKQGQVIAYVGNTGAVRQKPTPSNPYAGAHLHFEIWVNGERVNPESWL